MSNDYLPLKNTQRNGRAVSTHCLIHARVTAWSHSFTRKQTINFSQFNCTKIALLTFHALFLIGSNEPLNVHCHILKNCPFILYSPFCGQFMWTSTRRTLFGRKSVLLSI